jgi:hypothetical protein
MEANLLRQFISTSPAELLIAGIWQGLLLTTLAWAALPGCVLLLALRCG